MLTAHLQQHRRLVALLQVGWAVAGVGDQVTGMHSHCAMQDKVRNTVLCRGGVASLLGTAQAT
jgi:hypothetical protein